MTIDPLTGEPVVASATPAAPRRTRGLLAQAHIWRRLTLGLGLAIAILLGVTGELMLSSHDQGPSPRPTAAVTATPTPTATLLASPTDAATPSASPSVSFLPDAAPAAQVTFRDMLIDANASWARTFKFTSDGQGSIAAQVTASAPLASIKLCLSQNGQLPLCNQGAAPGVKIPTPPGDHAEWVTTIVGLKGDATPIVDVTFNWPTLSPSITLSKARFQGYPNPESLRGFQVEVITRKAGSLGLTASWGNVAAKATATLVDENVTPDKAIDSATVIGTSFKSYSHAVDAGHTYKLFLANRAQDKGKPSLTATITFP